MPDYPYSHTYAAGDECLSGKAWRPIIHRVNQRLAAVGRKPGRTADVAGMAALRTTPTTFGEPDTYPPSGDSTPWHFADVRRVLDGLKGLFVDVDAFDPETVGPSVSDNIPRLSDRPTWPGVNGWTRKREREITGLGDVGTDGQRARFVYSSLVSNPSEYPLGTKIMDRVGGAWVVSADQATPPDIVTTYGLPVGQGADPGEIFGPWVLNDIQAALDDMVWTVGDPWWRTRTQYAQSDPAGFVTLADAKADLAAAWGTYGAESLADAELMGNEYAGTWYRQTGFTTWTVDAVSTELRPVALDLPAPCNREVDFYVTTYAPGMSVVSVFDAQGTPFVDAGLTPPIYATLAETIAPGTGPAEGTAFGLPDGVLPTAPASGFGSEDLGWVVSPAGLVPVVRWDVAGGFD